jgi:hypothetical protein
MNIANPGKRETLTFEEFVKKNNDQDYKNPTSDGFGDAFAKTGLNKIKPQPQFAYIGFQDAAFKGTSKIDYPAIFNPDLAQQGYTATEIGVTESKFIKTLDEFESL